MGIRNSLYFLLIKSYYTSLIESNSGWSFQTTLEEKQESLVRTSILQRSFLAEVHLWKWEISTWTPTMWLFFREEGLNGKRQFPPISVSLPKSWVICSELLWILIWAHALAILFDLYLLATSSVLKSTTKHGLVRKYRFPFDRNSWWFKKKKKCLSPLTYFSV